VASGIRYTCAVSTDKRKKKKEKKGINAHMTTTTKRRHHLRLKESLSSPSPLPANGGGGLRRSNNSSFNQADGAYFDDLLFDEPPVPSRWRESALYIRETEPKGEEEQRRRRSSSSCASSKGEEERFVVQEENEEMKEINAIRRLTRPETSCERDALEIVKTISFREKGAFMTNTTNNEQGGRRESEDEERLREKCFRLKRGIEEMLENTGRRGREVHVATSSKFRGACALRNLVHSYVWIDPERVDEEEEMTLQQQHRMSNGTVGSATSSYSSQTTTMMMMSSSSSLPPNELNLQRVIVEADLRSHFVIANATPQYQRLLDELPSEFVGTFSRLLEIIDFMAVKLNSSFVARQMDTPPWRRAKSIASKWSMPIEDHHHGSVSGSPMNANNNNMYQQQQQVAMHQQNNSPQTVLNKKKDNHNREK
jgi:uncharacterized protein (TIGR01615 family)